MKTPGFRPSPSKIISEYFFWLKGLIRMGYEYFYQNIAEWSLTQHAHIYRVPTSNFNFGQFCFFNFFINAAPIKGIWVYSFTIPPARLASAWGGLLGHLMEWKQCNYITVEADILFKLIPTSIWNIYTVFEPLVCCLKGIWDGCTLTSFHRPSWSQIWNFVVACACGVKMMTLLRHVWGRFPPQTTLYIHIRYIQSVWVYAMLSQGHIWVYSFTIPPARLAPAWGGTSGS